MRRPCAVTMITARLSARLPLLGLTALLCSMPAAAGTFEVGPGSFFTNVSDVPWENLGPGDLVLIHHRPTPYREKFVLGTSGTAAEPIVVRGVPDPDTGALPIIDGENATTRLALDYWNENRSVIKVGGSSIPSDDFAEHVVIENLDIRGAYEAYSFTDDRGNPASYRGNASAIHIERGRNITIRGCILRDSGNGLFVSSGTDYYSSDILIEGCHLHGNGNVGSIFEHNNYTEALDITFQYNRFGPLRPGAGGNNLKDRSAGLIVRYNWIEAGNRQLDLVEAIGHDLLNGHPRYRETFVYGNVLVETEGEGNRQVIHYGGDSGSTGDYRKGTLYFHNNTVISTRTDRTTLMRLSTNDERCDARNNIIHLTAAGGDTLSMLDSSGILDWSHGWTNGGWRDSFSGGFEGAVNDDGTSLTGAEPGFVDIAGDDLSLRSDSDCVDAGTMLAAAVLPEHEPVHAYVVHQGQAPRGDDAVLDVGAYAAACALAPPGRVNGLGWSDPSTLTWPAASGATGHDVLRGEIATLGAVGLAGSLTDCLAADTAALSLSLTMPEPGRGSWFLVRGRTCGGPGSYDPSGSTRDAALSGAGLACP
ncbi:MAG: right-handed parallel beta-helix repeat-containing protein [Acidobacteriota bacterium]